MSPKKEKMLNIHKITLKYTHTHTHTHTHTYIYIPTDFLCMQNILYVPFKTEK